MVCMSVVLVCKVCVSGLYNMRGVYMGVVFVCVVCLSSMCGVCECCVGMRGV